VNILIKTLLGVVIDFPLYRQKGPKPLTLKLFPNGKVWQKNDDMMNSLSL
jgi:hypothetical protein